MGEIYTDIKQNDENSADVEMWNNLMSVSYIIKGHNNIKFRDTEINRIYNIMCKTELKSVLLVGDYGSGKRSIIEGYVDKLDKNARAEKVVEVDFNDILKKSQNSDFSKNINDVFNAAINNDAFGITLVLNNLGHLLNLNCYGNAGFSFVNTLTQAIEEDGLKIIATATTDEYKMIEDAFKRVLDFFTVIKLTELSKDESTEIINDELNYFGECYDMTFPKNVSSLICNNADKYIKDRVFPGKAERLFDEVCASISNKYRPTDERVLKLIDKSKKWKEELSDAMTGNDYFKCEEINKKLNQNYEDFKKLGDETYPTINVTEEDILEAIGEIVDVQMTRLDENKTK